MTTPNRWVLALAGLVIEIVFGAIYAWSVFSIPLSTRFGWTIPQVTLTFEITILVLGFVSFLSGFWLKHVDPRVVVVAEGFCSARASSSRVSRPTGSGCFISASD